MGRVKKDDPIASKIHDLRKRIQREVESEISREYAEARQAGKFPWEGMWLKPQEIGIVQRGMKKRDRVIFIEIIFLFFIMMLVSFMLLILIHGFTPKKKGLDITPYLDLASPSNTDSSVLIDAGPKPHINQKDSNRAESDMREADETQITKDEADRSAEPRTGRVTTDVLRLRDGPGIHYPIISRLTYGASITVQDTDGEWMKVVTDKLIAGWVFGEYIELDTPDRKRDFSYDHGIEAQPRLAIAGADADQAVSMNDELRAFRKADMPDIHHHEGLDETSELQASESHQQKLSRRAAAGDKEYRIQVGAWKHLAYAQSILSKLKKYYPEARIIRDGDLSKVVIPDVETEKQAYVIQHKIKRRFNLSPLLITNDRPKRIIEKKEDKEETAELAAVTETGSPGVNSESTEDAGITSDQVITDSNRDSVGAPQNVIPGIALIIESKTANRNNDTHNIEK